MPKFRKKPVVIEAFKYGYDLMPRWFVDQLNHDIYERDGCCEIHTLEGVMEGNNGDYIIQGVKGEIYPCKPDIFEATYEAAE